MQNASLIQLHAPKHIKCLISTCIRCIPPLTLCILSRRLFFFSFKINIFEQIIQEYYKSVKSLDPDHDGSDLGPNCLQRSSEDDTGNIANHTRGLANLTLDCLNCIHLGNCCGDQVISSLDYYCDVSCLILEKAYLYFCYMTGENPVS